MAAPTTFLRSLYSIWFFLISFLKLYLLSAWSLILQLFETHKEFHRPGIQKCDGLVAIVTGAERGIGFHVAKELAQMGYHVIIGSRKTEVTEAALRSLQADSQELKVEHIPLDLASLASVRRFVEEFLQRRLPLHLLINNAGVMLLPAQVTPDGHDRVFSVNYLGHLLLSLLLLDVMKPSSEKDRRARIINVSSVVHWIGDFADCDEIQGRPFYSSHMTYARSKLAVLMSTYEMNRRLSPTDLSHHLTTNDGDSSSDARNHVTVNAVHPGIVDSDLFRNMHWSWSWLQRMLARVFLKTPRQGADTILYAALSPALEARGGLYLSNCEPIISSCGSYDRRMQQKLWRESLNLIGMKESETL